MNQPEELEILGNLLKKAYLNPIITNLYLPDYFIMENKSGSQSFYTFFKADHEDILKFMFLDGGGIEVKDLNLDLEIGEKNFLELSISKNELERYFGSKRALKIGTTDICILEPCSSEKEFKIDDLKNLLKEILNNPSEFDHPIYSRAAVLGRGNVKTSANKKDFFFLLDLVEDYEINNFGKTTYKTLFINLLDNNKVTIDISHDEKAVKIRFVLSYPDKKLGDPMLVDNIKLDNTDYIQYTDDNSKQLRTYSLKNQSKLNNVLDPIPSAPQSPSSSENIVENFDSLLNKIIPFDTSYERFYNLVITDIGIPEYIKSFSFFLKNPRKRKVFVFKLWETLENINLDKNRIREILNDLKDYLDILKTLYQEPSYFEREESIFFHSTNLNVKYFYIPTSIEEDGEKLPKDFDDRNFLIVLNNVLEFILEEELKNFKGYYKGNILESEIKNVVRSNNPIAELQKVQYVNNNIDQKGPSQNNVFKDIKNARKISFQKKGGKIFILINT